ncbi:hypothetical protein Cva_00216 [Caedimonas varicaedens]|uniref:Aminoglycoside phosphotransferase domain-containing protein n=1 Tax=Caedimonas varicaedens TaxID=1629334 RepID=A0A0K8MAP3_9PROT|nr:hypothetical protein Cva_00216 [Caedimonas varicaedens]
MKQIKYFIYVFLLLGVPNIFVFGQVLASQFKEINIDETGIFFTPKNKIKPFLINNHYIAANENGLTKDGGYGKVFLYQKIAAKIFNPLIDQNHLRKLQENQMKMKALLKQKALSNYSLCFPNDIVKVNVHHKNNFFQPTDISFLQIMPKVQGKTLESAVHYFNENAILDLFARLGSELGKFQKKFLTRKGKDLEVYCHHDFHLRNIMIEDKSNKFKIIDLDFLAPNHPLVDPVFFLMRLWHTVDAENYWDQKLYVAANFLIPYLNQFDINLRKEIANDLRNGHKHILDCYRNKNQHFPLPARLDGKEAIFNDQFDLMLNDFCGYLSLPLHKQKGQATLDKLPAFKKYKNFHSQLINMVYDLHNGAAKKQQPLIVPQQKADAAQKKQAQVAAAQRKKADAAQKKQAQVAAAQRKKADAAQKKQAQVAAAQRKKADAAQKKQAQVAAAQRKKADAAQKNRLR